MGVAVAALRPLDTNRMLPVIALVGRPNVGKSTLFNVLTRTRDALVAAVPGLTRDRKYGEGKLGARPYLVVDTGGLSGDESGIDALMANAGVGESNRLQDVSEEELLWQTEVNFLGVIRCCRAVLPHMLERRSGHVLTEPRSCRGTSHGRSRRPAFDSTSLNSRRRRAGSTRSRVRKFPRCPSHFLIFRFRKRSSARWTTSRWRSEGSTLSWRRPPLKLPRSSEQCSLQQSAANSSRQKRATSPLRPNSPRSKPCAPNASLPLSEPRSAMKRVPGPTHDGGYE